MLKGRWQGFEIESGENSAPFFVTHWYTLKQTLIYALFSIPFVSGLGMVLAKVFLKPWDHPIEEGNETTQ